MNDILPSHQHSWMDILEDGICIIQVCGVCGLKQPPPKSPYEIAFEFAAEAMRDFAAGLQKAMDNLGIIDLMPNKNIDGRENNESTENIDWSFSYRYGSIHKPGPPTSGPIG